MSNPIIFGFVGQMGSGKGTAAKYLEEKYNAQTFRFSTMLRDMLDRLYLEHTRNNLVKLSEIIRSAFGEDIMAKTMMQDVIKTKDSLIIVEGIRRVADIEHLKHLPNFVLVEVYADPYTRYERVVKRNENEGDATKTFDEFMEDHKLSTEISIAEVITFATEKINNNGTPEEFNTQIDTLIQKYEN